MKTIILKPSHRCNLNCWFCYDRFNRSQYAKILPVEKCIEGLNKILTEWNSMGEHEYEIIWHGGEPMMLGVDYVRQVCENLNDKYDITWRMQSNVALANEQWGQLAKDYNIHIGASWDGIQVTNKDSHNNQYLLNAEQYLPEQMSALYVVTPENAKYIFDNYLYATEHNWRVAFNIVFGVPVTNEEYFEMATYLILLLDYICSRPDAYVPRPFFEDFNYVDSSIPVLCESSICAGRWIGMDFNGDITACGKPWPDSVVWGNIFDENFHIYNLYKNTNFKKFRENILKQWNHCRDCKYLFQCSNACPFSSTGPDGEIHFNEGYCYFKKTYMDMMLKLLDEKYENHTLYNKEILNYLQRSRKMEFVKWKNYKYPTIEI